MNQYKEYDEFKYDIISENEDGKVRQLYWNIAFGLQDVDSIKPSKYMLKLAKENVEGKLSYDELYKAIITYYHRKKDTKTNKEEQEADIVSARIFEMLSSPTFRFDYNTLKMYHRFLFTDIDMSISHKYIGRFRDYNITKKEPILNGDTVMYADYRMIEETLKYDFDEEQNQDYTKMTKEQIARRLATFTSRIWQVHAFGEGNTRTIAVFIQKYIMHLGFKKMNNELFKDNSKYFRNALVRANYTNITKGIKETDEYLVRFFMNLLYKKEYKLDNSELYIYKKKED